MAEAWGKPLKMSTKVNGEIRQNSDTSDLYFGIEALVAYASRSMTLFPGDIIATGSPAGVAYFMNPQRFLQPGDFVCCEIESVGVKTASDPSKYHNDFASRSCSDHKLNVARPGLTSTIRSL